MESVLESVLERVQPSEESQGQDGGGEVSARALSTVSVD